MGSTPTPPTPPDPVATASAQGQANVSTAIAQNLLNNPNQVTPYGTSTTAETGSYSYAQPDGSTSTVPTYTTTQTLSPEQQALYDQQVQLAGGMNSAAQQLVGTIQGNLATPVTAASLPHLQTSVGTGPTLLGGYDAGGDIASGYYPGGALQSGYASGGAIQNGYASGGSIQNGYASGGAIQSSVPWTAQGTSAPSTFGQTGSAIQDDVSLDNHAATTFGRTQAGPQYFQAGDFSAARDGATNAVLQRLAPTMAAQDEAQDAQLANQGLVQGSAAWNAAKLSQAQANNDLRLGAVSTGDQEQQALFGEQATGNQLFNAAQQQDYAQQQGRGLFALGAINQNNGATLDMANFHNAAQAQDFGQQQARGAFAQTAYGMDNAAIGANNAAALNAGSFANAAQSQGTEENAAAAAFGNSAQAQGNAQNAALAAFGNSAQAQAEQESAARAAFSNATQGAQNQENASAAAFGNQAQAQREGQSQQAAAFSNQAQDQAYQNWISGDQFANQAREQALNDQETINNNSINQASSLLHGGQVQNPQFQPYSASQIGQTPISQDTYASASLAEQQYQAELQNQAANTSSIFGSISGLFGLGARSMSGGFGGGSMWV